jgi:hypothetical protein
MSHHRKSRHMYERCHQPLVPDVFFIEDWRATPGFPCCQVSRGKCIEGAADVSTALTAIC